MSEFPDFSSHGYQIVRELGHNRAGGRVTYLAVQTQTEQQVAIKQFQFARDGANWEEYDAYQREIQVLQQLNHSGIPRYLDSFQTPTGFCMVQEYKEASSLAAVGRGFTPDEVKKIAVAVLEILAYLQRQVPPVIHRDIKPENILIDGQGNVYLVDFGFARVGAGEVAASSVVKGTLGFMPPEQLFNRQLTAASDLYGLGATLICLLTGTKSTDIGNLVDGAYRIPVKQLLPHLSSEFIGWLQKMAEPNVKDRFPDAAGALQALNLIDVNRRVPALRFPVMGAIALLVLLGGVVAGGGVLWGGDRAKMPAPKKLNYKAFSNVVLTRGLDDSYKPVDDIKEFSINSPLRNLDVYFYVSLFLDFQQSSQDEPFTEQEFTGGCKIFNPSGKLVYDGQSTLIADGNKLETWCLHEFDKKTDAPGNWRFEFYLDGKKVAAENLSVVSE